MKIGIVGSEHMGQTLPICLGRMGHAIVPPGDCDVCWIAIDTPVNKEGQGNIEPVIKAIEDVKSQLKKGVLVIVSSQIPVGTSKRIVRILGKELNYAYMPEHMKIGTGVADFMNLTEVVVGVDDKVWVDEIEEIFKGKKVVFTSVVTAEMIKHATNAFLATSLCFIYDIADLCEAVGADVVDVTRALRSDYRIGKEAYLDASVGFSGGHLERDLDYLRQISKSKNVSIPVIDSVVFKNRVRKQIVINALGDVKGKRVALWGVAYKTGAPPSNNSLPAKIMRNLTSLGANISACDPWFEDTDPYTSVGGCVAVVCITPWEELKSLDFEMVAGLMVGPKIFFDARNYFADLKDVIEAAGMKYIGVGR